MWKVKLKKYWKISLICLAGFFTLCYYLFIKKKDITNIDPENAVNKLQDGLIEIKDRIQEATNTAMVETVVAKKELIDVKKELNEVSEIKNVKERRNRLAELAVRSEGY